MPADLAEDSIDLTIELLEAGAPTPASYPYPSLMKTGRFETRSFRTILLENPYLQAVIVPDLGGRLLRLRDKRTDTDCLPFQPKLALCEGGRRGAICPAGLQVLTGFEERLNSMGTVATMPDFSEDEDEPAGLWVGEVCGDGLSLQIRYSIPPDAAWIELEVRAFNRQLEAVPYVGGIRLESASWRRDSDGWLTDNGLLIADPAGILTHADSVGLFRFNRQRWLAPRQLDSWTVRLIPFNRLDDLRGVSSQFAASWDRTNLVIQSSAAFSNAKIVVRTTADSALEIPADFRPEHPLEVSLTSLGDEVVELVVLSDRKEELLRASQIPEFPFGTKGEPEKPPIAIQTDDLQAETFNLANRHLAHLLLGYRKLAEKEYALATQAFEQSLLFNAEDHLTWWMKALAHRLAGEVEEERPELLNAHFLAPLEPALRAESYLAAPSQVKEKSAVLNPLEESPEVFVEVACLLLEANLLEEAAKWIDEALRHADLPMLRYLLAYAYLKGSRMDVQAGEQVQLAVRTEPEPPFPWRPIERQALLHLVERFSADGSLRRLLGMATQVI